ncbi:MAG: hypothetical protein R3C19_12335 [Planctomycetaceae bacterium]
MPQALSRLIDEGSSGFARLAFPITGIQNGAPDGVALVNALGTLVQFLAMKVFAGSVQRRTESRRRISE